MAKAKKTVEAKEEAKVSEPQILGEVVNPMVDAYLRTQPQNSIATESGWVDRNTGELLVSIPQLLKKLGR